MATRGPPEQRVVAASDAASGASVCSVSAGDAGLSGSAVSSSFPSSSQLPLEDGRGSGSPSGAAVVNAASEPQKPTVSMESEPSSAMSCRSSVSCTCERPCLVSADPGLAPAFTAAGASSSDAVPADGSQCMVHSIGSTAVSSSASVDAKSSSALGPSCENGVTLPPLRTPPPPVHRLSLDSPKSTPASRLSLQTLQKRIVSPTATLSPRSKMPSHLGYGSPLAFSFSQPPNVVPSPRLRMAPEPASDAAKSAFTKMSRGRSLLSRWERLSRQNVRPCKPTFDLAFDEGESIPTLTEQMPGTPMSSAAAAASTPGRRRIPSPPSLTSPVTPARAAVISSTDPTSELPRPPRQPLRPRQSAVSLNFVRWRCACGVHPCGLLSCVAARPTDP